MYRQRAEEAYYDLLNCIEIIGGISGMQQQNNIYIAPPSILKHPEGIALVLRQITKTSAIGGINHQSIPVLHLYVDFNKDIIQQLERREYRKTVIHEFIHVFDKERMTSMKPTSSLSKSDYYNSPVETNAYIQEALSDLEEIFRRMTPKARQVQTKRLSQSFDDFLNVMKDLLADDFFNYRRVKTDRALSRRLYKYWDEIVRNGVISS